VAAHALPAHRGVLATAVSGNEVSVRAETPPNPRVSSPSQRTSQSTLSTVFLADFCTPATVLPLCLLVTVLVSPGTRLPATLAMTVIARLDAVIWSYAPLSPLAPSPPSIYRDRVRPPFMHVDGFVSKSLSRGVSCSVRGQLWQSIMFCELLTRADSRLPLDDFYSTSTLNYPRRPDSRIRRAGHPFRLARAQWTAGVSQALPATQ
jgi:hypothetical protein